MAYVSNARKQTKRGGSKNDSPTTAGVGKVSSGGGKSRGELEALAARHGWAPRPLNAHDVTAMGADEIRYHEVFNSAALEKVFTSQKVDKYNAEVRTNQAANRMWQGEATQEESQRAFAAGDRFASNYGSFVRTEANAKAITQYMEEHNLDATQVQSYIEAFDELAPQGKLVLSPKAAGIGPQETLTGAALQQYPRLHLLCQPNKVLKPQDKLSADEWFREHPELHDLRPAPIVAARNAKAEVTAQHFKQTAEHTSKANVVTLLDYPDQPHGVPPESEKFSFKAKIRSMSASELAERCQLDPAFKKSLDEMK